VACILGVNKHNQFALIQVYRRKDAASEDESEMVENYFNALCSLLNEPENKQRFLESEGIELMVIMMK
jgi:beta-catenin-like protein 1